MSGQAPPDSPDRGRRRFLAVCTTAVGACAGAIVAAPVIAELVAPVGKRTVKGGEGLLDLGKIEDFQPGEPRKVIVQGPSSDAWMTSQEELGPVYVVRGKDDSFTAFSAICPHLGCAVDWETQNARYYCPCHDSYFAQDGGVQTGPSPRGLDPLPVTTEKGRVLLRFRRFRVGGAERVEV